MIELSCKWRIRLVRLLMTLTHPLIVPRRNEQRTMGGFINRRYRYEILFIGREELLNQIHSKLTRQKTTALTHRQAISIYGLGGIGKTALAVEYVYRFREDYTQVFWINADTRETLIREYVEIAQDLVPLERNEKNQIKVVEAVMRWMETNAGWLLVLDNADDLKMI